MSNILMACGHTANATDKFGNNICAICIGLDNRAIIEVDDRPDLTGRLARCSMSAVHGKPTAYGQRLPFSGDVPSSFALPFFEYRGPGSVWAEKYCANCGMNAHAHEISNRACDGFVAIGPAEFDVFYCGCRGWD